MSTCRRLMLIAAFGSTALFWVAHADIASGSPMLQLPWPTNEQHRIYGGYTYGCQTHGGAG
jgi:hypothetical protein